jgi:hypothetical protein
MSRLILHMGTHKTGTTTIQGTLERERERLRAAGIHYPDAVKHLGGGSDAHHAFAHAMNGTDSRKKRAALKFAEHVSQESQQTDTIVISAEALYRHVLREGDRQIKYWEAKRRYLEGIAEAFSGFDIEVVIFLRRQDRFVESLYSETVAKRMIQQPFYRWRDTLRRLSNYSAQIDLLRSVFAEVAVFRYEDAREGVEKVFFDHLGVDVPKNVIYDRRSPDARVLLWMRLTQPGTWPLRREFASSDDAMGLFEDYGRTTLWGSLTQRLEFLHQFEGPYGHEFFVAPTVNGTTAQLDDETAGRVSEAWEKWLMARNKT